MMRQVSPLLGLCPIGKFVFSNEDAVRQKIRLQERLRQWNVNVVDLDGVIEDGLVKDQKQVEAVVGHLKSAGVDCLFIPHCNFGTEGAAAMIAHKLGLPTLLWGPRDESPLPDGTRLRDSLCGLLATSKVLHKLGVTFTYVENCHLDEPSLERGVDRFLRTVSVADTFRRGVRIGQVGQRIDFFWTTICNESELLERFNVQVVPIDMVTFIRNVKSRADEGRAGYEQEIREMRANCIVEDLDNDAFARILAVRDQLLALAEDLALDGLAIQDFMSLVDEIGAYCFFANSLVCDRIPIGCESDLHGAISGVLLRRALFNDAPVFLADITARHPENDNAVLLWHAGAPVSMRHPQSKVRLGKHWILPSPLSGMPHFQLKDGPITLLRFDGDRGEYKLAVGEGQTVVGPDTLNNYTWMEVSDWPAWERALIQGPFIHHAAMGYEHVSDAIAEAARYMPGIDLIRL